MKLLTFVASLVLALIGVTGAQADNFPSKPITIVVGFAPGGPTDTTARVLAEHMKKTLGETVVVENQAGAAGTIAYNRVGRADPDGYTLYLGNWTVNVGASPCFRSSMTFSPGSSRLRC
jgi:tripartite-type tricarboxylate transporter receptor subunit TctC